jgi:hypothetical protein
MWLVPFGSTQPTKLLHWKNGRWTSLVMPVNAGPVMITGDKDIWAEGVAYICPPPDPNCRTISHWNGSTWTSYRIAARNVESASASSSANVWVVGDVYDGRTWGSTTFRPYVFRWTGSAWKRTSLPGGPPDSYPGIVANSAHDVYVAEASRSHPRACAMHWTGGRWIPLYLPESGGSCGGWIAPDYQRGVWFMAPPATSGFGYTFVHWTGRRFITTPAFVPGSSYDGSAALAAIPHSRFVWLFGNICTSFAKCVHKGTIAILR